MNPSFSVGCVSVGTAILCAGCLFSSREVSVSGIDSFDDQREYYRNELISHDGLALESANFLRGNLLQGDLRSDPVMVLKRLNEFFEVSENPKYLLIAADLCRYLATLVDEEESIRYHLSSYYYCTSYFKLLGQNSKSDDLDPRLEKTFSHNLTVSQGFQCLNEACSGIFSYLKKRDLLDASAVSLRDREGHEFVMEKPEYRLSLPRESIESFSLCASYEVKNLMQINRNPGVGVPLVAAVKERQWYSSLKTPKGLTIPVTFFVERNDKGPGPIPLRLRFFDTFRQEVFNSGIGSISKVRVGLALDFSTPLACFLNSVTDRNLLLDMLNFKGEESSDGLYMVEPYQPNKIPVVFVHGLMSSPETWMQMINALKNDPTVRSRYQFWFFSYATGAPVLFSAQKLRTALLAAEKEFCTTPEATENFNRMVLVGHSMGGLLTRLMVQKDPNYIFERIYKMPIDQIRSKLQKEDFELLDSFTPYPLPFVHRAVYMAVPHKGANMAQSPIGRLGVYCISLPKSLLSQESSVSRINRTLIPGYSEMEENMGNRFYTGIDNLDPDNPFVLANGSSPMKEDLTCHCVIGNIDRADAPDGSDGIVPYWSSHLDTAASELIVKSNHSVHRRPAAMQELLRILLLHLKSGNAVDGNPGVAHGGKEG